MQRHRFHAPPEAHLNNSITLSPDESHHLLRVVRLKIGDEIFVFDGQGNEYRSRFAGVENKLAVVDIVEKLEDLVESPLQLTLAQALTKGEKFDFIVQKATELGVHRIVPLRTEYVDLRLNAEQGRKRLERWQRISLEALKQSGRRKIVEITLPISFGDFLESAYEESDGELMLFNERGGAKLETALASLSNKQKITAIIGPEGGWSDQEINQFNRYSNKSISLGRRILRTETAAIAAITLLQYRLGDLSP